MSALDAVLRVSYPRALSTLARLSGSLAQAEDLLQEAVTKAVVHWRETGVPTCPEAWLVRTARNLAIDGHRRNMLAKAYAVSASKRLPLAAPPLRVEEVGLRDDMLRLIFTCCHPALPREAQVALTLKAVGGLSVAEIARAFLVPPRTIEQRITRAKRRIRTAGVPYEVPAPRELPDRLDAVLAVVHLIFNEGYSASIDAPLIRHELCRMAIGQGRRLCHLFPDEAEVAGLLALLLLSHARAAARLTADGVPISLDRQDRSLWDRGAINEGLALLDGALRRGRPGPYQIQAAISACHGRARSWAETDWPEILRLYDALLALTPSPVVRLNRAVAVSRVAGPQDGLRLLDTLEGERRLTDQHAFHAVRAGLLAELGRYRDARRAFGAALARTQNAIEQAFCRQKIAEMEKIEQKSEPGVGE